MNGYRIFRTLSGITAVGLAVAGALAGFVAFIIHELLIEARYRRVFGNGWHAAFEKDFGPLARAHGKIALGVVGIVSISLLAVWLGRILLAVKESGHRSRSSRRNHHWFGGPERYRRNAFLAVVLGAFAILAGAFMFVFRLGILEEHADEMVLGVFVFVGGYFFVLAGCRWWLKAKEWNDAIILVGVAPLAIFFLPFIRVVLRAVPLLVPVSMLMAPFILIVLVAALPDKAAASRRRYRRRHD